MDADPALRRFAAQLWAAGQGEANSDDADDDAGGNRGSGGNGGGDLNAMGAARRPIWHSIWVNLNPSRRNNIVSHEDGAWRLLHAHAAAPDDGGGDEEEEAEAAAEEEEGHGVDEHIRGGALIERLPSGAAIVLPPYVSQQASLYAFPTPP